MEGQRQTGRAAEDLLPFSEPFVHTRKPGKGLPCTRACRPHAATAFAMIALLLGSQVQAFVRPPMVGVMAPAIAAKSPAPQMNGPDALQALAARIEILQFQMQAQWFAIPIGYFIASRWMENVNRRYDRIWGPDNEGGGFNMMSGRRGQRGYGLDYDSGYGVEPYDRYGYEPFDRGFRSAPEIFSAGLDNFIRNPSGWLSRSDRYYPDRSTYNSYSSRDRSSSGSSGYGPNRVSAGRYFADRNSDRSINSQSRYSGRYSLDRGGSSGRMSRLPPGRYGRYDDYESSAHGRVIPTDSVSSMSDLARQRRERWLHGPPPV